MQVVNVVTSRYQPKIHEIENFSRWENKGQLRLEIDQVRRGECSIMNRGREGLKR